MLGSILIFDIETIPDCSAGRRLYDLGDLSDAEVASALYAKHPSAKGNAFLPHHLHQIVAISVVLHTPKQIKVWSLGETSDSEATLLERFFSGIEKFNPTLVSWNGQGFDLPVIHYRSLFHAIPAPGYWETGDKQADFRWNNYLNRFHARHTDLMDVLAAYNNRAFAPLHEMATLCGFPGKLGMDGSKVWPAYQANQINEIRAYCETDVLNTYLLYLRFECLRAMLTRADYEQYSKRLQTYLQTSTETHLKEFLTAWKAT